MENQVPNPHKGKAIAAMVLGIVACVLCWFGLILAIIAVVCAVIGLILAVSANKGMKADGITEGKGMATAGLVLSIIGLAVGAIGLVCAICVVAAANQLVGSLGALDF